MQINIKKLTETAILPTYGTEFSAGADLYLDEEEDIYLKSGETQLAHTGISVEIPQGYVGLIFARSGLASKSGLAPANKVGVIDSDYRGEIMVALHNHNIKPSFVKPGDRIAQLVIVPYIVAEWNVVDTLSDTVRGSGGFGSTDSASNQHLLYFRSGFSSKNDIS